MFPPPPALHRAEPAPQPPHSDPCMPVERSLSLPTPSQAASPRAPQPEAGSAWDALLLAAAQDAPAEAAEASTGPAGKRQRVVAQQPSSSAARSPPPREAAPSGRWGGAGRRRRRQVPARPAAARPQPLPPTRLKPVQLQLATQQLVAAPAAAHTLLPPAPSPAAPSPRMPTSVESSMELSAGPGEPAVVVQVEVAAAQRPCHDLLLALASLEPEPRGGAPADEAQVVVRQLSPLERVAATLLPQPVAQMVAASVPAPAAPALTQLLLAASPGQAASTLALLLARCVQQQQQAALVGALAAHVSSAALPNPDTSHMDVADALLAHFPA